MVVGGRFFFFFFPGCIAVLFGLCLLIVCLSFSLLAFKMVPSRSTILAKPLSCFDDSF